MARPPASKSRERGQRPERTTTSTGTEEAEIVTLPDSSDEPQVADENRRNTICVFDDEEPDEEADQETRKRWLNKREFKELAAKDIDILWELLIKRERRWIRYEMGQDERALESTKELEDCEAEYEALKAQFDECKIERDEAIRRRDAFAFQLLDSPRSQTTNPQSPSAPIVEAKSKSAKMPDAPMFDDGKEVAFEDWRPLIENKLLTNADHYPTATHRITYIASRCIGRARKHIGPRMRKGSTQPYEDMEDMLDHLEGVFGDPNKKAQAREQYTNLTMNPKDDFGDFLAEFVRLAEEAEQPVQLRKQDLYKKLPRLLQNQVMRWVNKESTSFDKFARNCQDSAMLINLQVPFKPRGRSTTTFTETLPPTASSSSLVKREKTAAPTSDRATYMKEGRCFNCGEQGHVARNCTKEKKKPTVTLTPASTELAELEGSDNERGEDRNQSGKAST